MRPSETGPSSGKPGHSYGIFLQRLCSSGAKVYKKKSLKEKRKLIKKKKCVLLDAKGKESIGLSDVDVIQFNILSNDFSPFSSSLV